jgi:Outer membrane receptor for ferrienterochelin and colicins
MFSPNTRLLWLPLLVVTLLINNDVFAQSGGAVHGTVVDSASNAPLEYASVAIYHQESNTLVNGAITDHAGYFNIEVPYGNYYAEISFLGFATIRLPAFALDQRNPARPLGKILLQPTQDMLNEITVRAEKSTMELTLDKKIFNVGQDLANSGGSASDILMNIPSVAVDPEGNVRLRGSDNVRILIDGKPSGLVSFKGGSGLQQLPASMIERVEVVTNPSARYEAEGLGGVINIILKKETNQGFNGSFDVIGGHPDNYGLAANVNYRHRKVNFFINYSIAYRDQPGFSRLYQEVYGNHETLLLQQSNEASLSGLNNNIRGGIDIYFTEKSILTGSYLFRRSDAKRITDIIYRDYLNTLTNPIGYNTRRQDEDEVEPNSEYSLIYKKIFTGKGHELVAEAKFLDNWEYSVLLPMGLKDRNLQSFRNRSMTNGKSSGSSRRTMSSPYRGKERSKPVFAPASGIWSTTSSLRNEMRQVCLNRSLDLITYSSTMKTLWLRMEYSAIKQAVYLIRPGSGASGRT